MSVIFDGRKSKIHTSVMLMLMLKRHRSGLRACALVSNLLLTGCVVVPDQRHYVDGVVMVAPPAPRGEVIGVAPVDGYVWAAGYWRWIGDRHEWVPGRWVAPRAGWHWVNHRWVRMGDGWRMRPGHWERD